MTISSLGFSVFFFFVTLFSDSFISFWIFCVSKVFSIAGFFWTVLFSLTELLFSVGFSVSIFLFSSEIFSSETLVFSAEDLLISLVSKTFACFSLFFCCSSTFAFCGSFISTVGFSVLGLSSTFLSIFSSAFTDLLPSDFPFSEYISFFSSFLENSDHSFSFLTNSSFE